MLKHVELRPMLKSTMKMLLIITLQSITWMIVQAIIIEILNLLHLSPYNFFSAPEYGFAGVNFLWGVVYEVTCLKIGAIYTVVGIVVCNLLGINSKVWWIAVLVLYMSYMVITLVGMMDAMGIWFYEGYGLLIFDVWLAPILWLGELELWRWIKRRRRLLAD